MARNFEIADANALIPSLNRAFERITAVRAELDTWLEDVQQYGIQDVSPYLSDPEAAPEAARATVSRIGKLATILESEIRTIHESGALVKDLDLGLVDFPSRLNGRDVLLCWKAGETEIRFWHDTDKGFRSRRPLLRVVGGEPDSEPPGWTDPKTLN